MHLKSKTQNQNMYKWTPYLTLSDIFTLLPDRGFAVHVLNGQFRRAVKYIQIAIVQLNCGTAKPQSPSKKGADVKINCKKVFCKCTKAYKGSKKVKLAFDPHVKKYITYNITYNVYICVHNTQTVTFSKGLDGRSARVFANTYI